MQNHRTVVIAALCATWGCNKVQRTPLREPALSTASLVANDWDREQQMQDDHLEGLDAVDPACRHLGAKITHCLPPNGGTVEAGPEGATIATMDGNFKLTIPPAALARNTSLRIGPAIAPPWTTGYVSHAYDLGPEGVTFAIPATLSLAHAIGDLPNKTGHGRLAVHMVVDGQWTRLQGSNLDVASNVVTAPIERLGTAATLVPTTALNVLAATAAFHIGEVRQLSVTTVPEGRAVTWSVVPAGIATINSLTGVLSAHAPGRARIVAASGGFISQASIVVLPAPTERY